jgi:HSP20 family molecular chaperone IbpA
VCVCLQAVFDAHYFQASDIDIRVENWELIVQARNTETRDDREFIKTMIRRIKLPSHVDPKNIRSHLSRKGILTVEMPFHLPPQRRPHGPNVFPIIHDADGRRKIRLMTEIGAEFSNDDVTIETNGRTLQVVAAYNEDVGKYAQQVNTRELKREFTLPEHVKVDCMRSSLAPDGRLHIEIILQEEPPYTCEVSAEEIDSEDVNGEEEDSDEEYDA